MSPDPFLRPEAESVEWLQAAVLRAVAVRYQVGSIMSASALTATGNLQHDELMAHLLIRECDESLNRP